METNHQSNNINIMYPELNELENVGGDLLNKIDLFLVNSTNFDDKQRKELVELFNEIYAVGLVDGLSADD